jgi:hypothetical protein
MAVWTKPFVPDGGPPRYDPTKLYGRGQEPPLTEEYRLIHEASLVDEAEGGQGLYRTSARCLPMGMPWQMYGLFPLEFVITPNTERHPRIGAHQRSRRDQD